MEGIWGNLGGFWGGVSGLCALHALNNLLQRPWLSQASGSRIWGLRVSEFGGVSGQFPEFGEGSQGSLGAVEGVGAGWGLEGFPIWGGVSGSF
uniref:Ubiquitinyl hydrolase 1 n=1 Tax=Taeniopygia guttata TaxID=59729 RepID=A0A674HD67_TAEGU